MFPEGNKVPLISRVPLQGSTGGMTRRKNGINRITKCVQSLFKTRF